MAKHPVALGKVTYELFKVVEFDVEIGDDQFTVRVELLQSNSDVRHFRARLWRTEMYRLQSTFPQDPSTNEPAHAPSDEIIWVDHSHYLGKSYSDFEADSQEAALRLIMEDYQTFLRRVAGQGGNENNAD